MFKSRNGFGLDSIIILISTIAIIAIMIGVGKVFMTTLENSYVSLTTSMPKFSTTGDYPDTIHNKTDSLLSVYNMLRSGIIWAIAAVLMIAGILFMLEQIEVVPASTAFGIISKGTLYFVILFGFPPIWDLYASVIELGSKTIMDPANTGQTPDSVVKVFDTINGMGISQGKVPQVDNSVLNNLVQLFNGSDILSTFSDQGKALILGAIGSILSLILSFLTYMFAAIRQVLTAVLVAGLPVILILSLVPWFQGITKRLYDTLFGLSLVPIFSALVMVTGAAYLGSITTHPVEEQWFASVAVLTLSTFIPTILVPLLGSLFSSITSMASTDYRLWWHDGNDGNSGWKRNWKRCIWCCNVSTAGCSRDGPVNIRHWHGKGCNGRRIGRRVWRHCTRLVKCWLSCPKTGRCKRLGI